MWTTRCSQAVTACAALLLVCAAALAARPPSAAAAPARPLDNEDVVRMTAHGMQPAEIIRTIREAPDTSFDLDPEVVDEMRAVGVAEEVIRVMTEVQRARAPAPSPAPAPVTEAAGRGAIDLIIETEPDAGKTKRLPLPPIEVSFYLFCLDPTHVPDFWQTKTPLAEGFPRHHLLWFQEGPKREGTGKRGRTPPVPLQLPGRTAIPAEPGVHPIEVGLAVRDDRKVWRPLVMAQTAIEVKSEETTRLVVRARVRKAPGKAPLTLEIVEPPQPPAPVTAPAPADIKR